MFQIRDFNHIIDITYYDCLKYHGYEMLGGVALGYKLLTFIFKRLDEKIPERGYFHFYSGMGNNAKGILDVVEFVTRARSDDKFDLDINKCKNVQAPDAPGGGKYYFELIYKYQKICVALNKGLIAEEFIKSSKLAHYYKSMGEKMPKHELTRLMSLRKELSETIMNQSEEELFSVIE